jgi:hypothetical protein
LIDAVKLSIGNRKWLPAVGPANRAEARVSLWPRDPAAIGRRAVVGEASVTTDGGRWHAEIEASTHGHTLDGDYVWPFPPVSMWLLGGWSTVFGADSISLAVALQVVFLPIVVGWYLYARAVAHDVPSAFWPAAFILAVGAALRLDTGRYVHTGRSDRLSLHACRSGNPGVPRADAMGTVRGRSALVLCGFPILTKQDFWPPAVFMLVAGGFWRYGWPERGKLWASAFLSVFVGALVIALTAGIGTLPEVAGGSAASIEGWRASFQAG